MLVDNKIIYVKSCSAFLSEFDEFEQELKASGVEYFSALQSQPSYEQMLKLTTSYWCISLEKKTFVRMQKMNEEFYTGISMDEFKKKHVAVFANPKYGL